MVFGVLEIKDVRIRVKSNYATRNNSLKIPKRFSLYKGYIVCFKTWGHCINII
jgi:hypothetical protein